MSGVLLCTDSILVGLFGDRVVKGSIIKGKVTVGNSPRALFPEGLVYLHPFRHKRNGGTPRSVVCNDIISETL